MSRARVSTGRAGAAVAAALLLGGCHDPVEDAALRAAAEVARERNAWAGAAAALLLALSVRHVADARDETGPGGSRRPRYVGNLPGPLVAAMLASEVVGMLLIGGLGAFLGYLFGPAPDAHDWFDEIGTALTALFGLPLYAPLVALAIGLLRQTDRLPFVPTSSLGWSAAGHLVALLLGATLAFAQPGPATSWRVAGAGLAAAGLVGAGGFAAGVVARRRARRRRAHPAR